MKQPTRFQYEIHNVDQDSNYSQRGRLVAQWLEHSPCTSVGPGSILGLACAKEFSSYPASLQWVFSGFSSFPHLEYFHRDSLWVLKNCALKMIACNLYGSMDYGLARLLACEVNEWDRKGPPG